jgi:hypothetical protein
MAPRPDFGQDSYKGHGRLKDRVALITGGDSGIGRAVALAFAREGADVAFTYLAEEADAAETVRWVEDAGRRALKMQMDLDSEGACREAVRRTVEAFGRIDLLINNAANQEKPLERFEDLSWERLEKTFHVNILAMFMMVKHALPHMKEGGAVVNVASIQAYDPSPGILDYSATKGAIVTFTKALAKDLVKRGIRVNAVAPGPVWTPLIPQSFEGEHLSMFGSNTPMGRPAQPAELAPAFVFLASMDASYVNGEILGVTGGRPLG